MIQNPELDEDSSDEWEQIKDYVGGANKQSKHPLQMEQDRIQRRKPQHMDEGGTAGILDGLNVGPAPDGSDTDPRLAPHPIGQAPIQAPAQPAQAPVAPPAVGTPPPTVAAQPAPATAPTDASYDAQASKALGGVTPEMIQALAAKFARPTAGQAVGMGVAGIGDAIASVGGREPGHMKNAMDMFQKNREMQMKVPEAMAAAGKEKFGLSQTLQNKDPASPYSKIAQQTYGTDLIKMGLTKDQVAKMPADLIGDLMSKKVTLTEALARIQETGAYQQGMLENTRTGLENTARHEKVDESIRGREQGFKEDTEASKHWLAHPFKASEARSRLAGGSAGAPSQSFETEADAEAAHLPSGTVVSIGGRPARVK
jgi:hypothetical protein